LDTSAGAVHVTVPPILPVVVSVSVNAKPVTCAVGTVLLRPLVVTLIVDTPDLFPAASTTITYALYAVDADKPVTFNSFDFADKGAWK